MRALESYAPPYHNVNTVVAPVLSSAEVVIGAIHHSLETELRARYTLQYAAFALQNSMRHRAT
jgi:hypothetical protein